LTKEKSDLEKVALMPSIFSQDQEKVLIDKTNSKITDTIDELKVAFPLASIYNSQQKDTLIENSPDNSPNSFACKNNREV